MRGIVVVAVALSACGPSADEKRTAADAKAANFRPPSVISRVDYGSVADRRFRTLDRDGNDIITPPELPRADSRLRELDRNGDTGITLSEWGEGMLARFDGMDLNRDGTLTSEERLTARRSGRPALPIQPSPQS
jgi:hypothetical protein